MGSSVSSCTDFSMFERDLADMCQQRGGMRHGAERHPEEEVLHARGSSSPAGPQLALRVVYAPMEASHGAQRSPFEEGDEVALVRLEKVRGWEPLGWRQERSAKERASAAGSGGRPPWPRGPRFSAAQRFWGAQVIASDGREGFEEHWCMLQVAAAAEQRDLETARLGVQDARDVASYAHRFNAHTARAAGEEIEPEEAPGVKVCAVVACTVLGSTVPNIAVAGEAVTLTLYPYPDVKKFVFEGGEDFLELPQAFFHYVAWTSGGRELVGDLQGIQDENGFVIVDPVMLKAAQPTIGNLLSAAVAGPDSQTSEEGGSSQDRFNLWHPRCGQLCRSFDPQRRSCVHARRHCGMSAPSCGVAGGA